MLNILFLLVTLTSNVQTSAIGSKTYIVFEQSYSEPLDVDYGADYLVIFNTPDGPVIQGFFFVVPAGTQGGGLYPYRLPAGWAIDTWVLQSWAPYIE